MKKTFWICFDFGMKGDYQNLYYWLDINKAEERGFGLALISHKTFPKALASRPNADKEFVMLLKDEIKKVVSLTKTDRIYIIWTGIADSKPKGAFLFGGKKASPWEGSANIGTSGFQFDNI